MAGLVKFLCAEMAAAFAAAGRSVPPWRAQVQLYASLPIHMTSTFTLSIREASELTWHLFPSLHSTWGFNPMAMPASLHDCWVARPLQAAMLSKWQPVHYRDERLRPSTARPVQPADAVAADDPSADSSIGSSTSSSSAGDEAATARLGAGCSPTSSLEFAGGSGGQQKLPAAAANSAQRPLAVQTGFAVPAGASLLSRELGSAALWQEGPARKAPPGQRLSSGGRSVRFADDAVVPGGADSRREGCWRVAGSGDNAEVMPAIRTVKMTGRCR